MQVERWGEAMTDDGTERKIERAGKKATETKTDPEPRDRA